MDASSIREFFEAQIGEKKKFPNRAKMAKFLGLSQTTQTKFFNFLDGSNAAFDTVWGWMMQLGFTIAPPDEKLEGFSLVNMVDAKPGAGESFETSNRIVGQYAFRDEFMRREGLHADKCILMRVIGDSMVPTILPGDTVLVDESEKGRTLMDGEIFVVGLDDAFMIKRIVKIPGGWGIRSDNKNTGENLDLIGDDLNFRVYGRVRWFGRVLRDL